MIHVDDFIEDANNYAFGKQTVVGDDSPAKQSTQDFLKGLDKKSVKIYRHATFTLTEKSIGQLDELSKNVGMAKSKLLRILIDDFHMHPFHLLKNLLNNLCILNKICNLLFLVI